VFVSTSSNVLDVPPKEIKLIAYGINGEDDLPIAAEAGIMHGFFRGFKMVSGYCRGVVEVGDAFYLDVMKVTKGSANSSKNNVAIFRSTIDNEGTPVVKRSLSFWRDYWR
jgi:hypothetical protein